MCIKKLHHLQMIVHHLLERLLANHHEFAVRCTFHGRCSRVVVLQGQFSHDGARFQLDNTGSILGLFGEAVETFCGLVASEGARPRLEMFVLLRALCRLGPLECSFGQSCSLVDQLCKAWRRTLIRESTAATTTLLLGFVDQDIDRSIECWILLTKKHLFLPLLDHRAALGGQFLDEPRLGALDLTEEGTTL